MNDNVDDNIKKKIFTMISTPGIEIEDIVKEVDLEYDEVMKILTDEYLHKNLDFGRRLCCRF
ncbi:MAG: hypothetical protein P8Y70_15855 [Candidatus Lokiarchaeota archaeon]